MQQEPVGEKKEAVTIKKYPNRRLYDTSARRYVNLEDLAAMIREGQELRVLDAKTGDDLTRVVLTQIIVEDAKGQPSGLPLELLRQLIVASDRAGQEVIMWYLKSAFDTYQKLQDTVQTRLSDVRTAALSPLTMMRSLLSGQPPAKPVDETEELRLRVAELEARLAQPAPPRKRAPRKKA
jgi:polyhydroxyalkanoate synthesis repressor PhaR